MELRIISDKEYLTYALNHEYISIYQLPEWGELKEITGWKKHLLGIYVDEKLEGVTLLLEKKLPLKISLFYSPRGFLFDVSNYELFKEFTSNIKKYLKKHNGFMLKVDPNIIYATYDSNGDKKNEIGRNIYDNFDKLKYKHLGWTKNFETMQPRFLCRFNILDTYEKTLNSFSKNTRKHIEKTEKIGVKTREISIEEIEDFVSILKASADEKDFVVRPVYYYKKMYELMSDYMKLYITYIDTKAYYEYINNELNSALKEKEELEVKLTKYNVGNKMKTQELQNKQKIEKLTKSLEEAKALCDKSPEINIGALMSLFVKDEGITFMSGTSSAYKQFNPKYAYYNQHIKDCIKQNKKYCNFYGISGNLDKDSEYYSIYEIKKGFNPEVIELIGEFDLIINKYIYYLYKIALKFYKLLK